MKQFVAVVRTEGDKIAKFQDFDTQAEADAHVTEYGGWVAPYPGGGLRDWGVDAAAKTLAFDRDAATLKAQRKVWDKQIEASDYNVSRVMEDMYDALDEDTQGRVPQITRDRIAAKKTLREQKP